MPSITTWNRLEPLADDADPKSGLQATLHDPLWMLARQRQLGEFQGEDGGSPVEVSIAARSSGIASFRAGDPEPSLSWDPQREPLEVLVEAEPDNEVSLRDAARAGLAFLRLLRSHERLKAYVGRVVRTYGFQAVELQVENDPATRRFLQSVQTRTPDGRRLHSTHREAFLEDRSLASARLGIPVDETDEPAFRTLLAGWMGRHWDLFEPAKRVSSWLPQRMERRFAVATQGGPPEVVLEAWEYHGDRLDWHSFRRGKEPLSTGRADPQGRKTSVERERRLLPTRLGFPGMRKPRFWQFEDARIDFGKVSAGAFDLARMLLLEFAAGYRNNWHLVPLDLEVGAWHRIETLTVRDTFGMEFPIAPAGGEEEASPWRMFTISGGRVGDGLFLAPVAARALSGDALEEVRLARDEMANYGWAVEKMVENRLGLPVERAEQTSGQPVSSRAPDLLPKYRLGSTVPDHWFPLIPVTASPGGPSIRFRLGSLGQSLAAAPTRPMGKLLKELAAAAPPTLFEEEIPRSGAVVCRIPRLARWIDGSTHVWIARLKKPGPGQADSGLRFDILE